MQYIHVAIYLGAMLGLRSLMFLSELQFVRYHLSMAGINLGVVLIWAGIGTTGTDMHIVTFLGYIALYAPPFLAAHLAVSALLWQGYKLIHARRQQTLEITRVFR